MDRTATAVVASKVAALASRRLGRGGTALPGLVAERIEPRIVARLARRLGGGPALVTGTNGKTTTSRMLAGIIEATGAPVIHNRSGSNLMRGLAATLTAAAAPNGRMPAGRRTTAVLEVDEATVPQAAAAVGPLAVAFTNLFRDQLDRYGEVDSIAAGWRSAVARLDPRATIVLNADDPSVAALRHVAPGRVLTFGVEDTSVTGGVEEHPADARWCASCGTEFAYAVRFFWHVGHWRCPGCGDARPAPDVAALAVERRGECTRIDLRLSSGGLSVELPLAGLYNVYNALAATAAAVAMGAPPEAIRAGLLGFSAAFGRQEALRIDGRAVLVLLCKNPAGVNQVLRTIIGDGPPPAPQSWGELDRAGSGWKRRGSGMDAPTAPTESGSQDRALSIPAETGSSPPQDWGAGGGRLHLVILLNDGIADGRDVSWIWDVDFELLAGRVDTLVVSGTRAADMALRLKYAGLGDRVTLAPDPRAAVRLALARTPPDGRLHVLPTYTAMLSVREHLASLAGKGRFWEE